MSAEDEEQDRIDQLIAALDWCEECGVPIGVGRCDGCIAVASLEPMGLEDEYDDDR